MAIARVESTWDPKATNGTHFGLWQISTTPGLGAGLEHARRHLDPLLNARYAFALYSDQPGSGEAKFADWNPFEKTDYRQFLDLARQAVAGTGGTANVTNNGCTASPIQVAGELGRALGPRRCHDENPERTVQLVVGHWRTVYLQEPVPQGG